MPRRSHIPTAMHFRCLASFCRKASLHDSTSAWSSVNRRVTFVSAEYGRIEGSHAVSHPRRSDEECIRRRRLKRAVYEELRSDHLRRSYRSRNWIAQNIRSRLTSFCLANGQSIRQCCSARSKPCRPQLHRYLSRRDFRGEHRKMSRPSVRRYFSARQSYRRLSGTGRIRRPTMKRSDSMKDA